ncbi:MAG: DUF4157 domain-containing protein [Deltaproteobacteria bacterium]|nr:DUF4157 domain-containing protein [Deltaproteobacteria bacterium]
MQDRSRKRSQVHCKLKIGATNDPLEAEADRIADRIMGLPSVERSHLDERGSNGVEEVRRKTEADAVPQGGVVSASVASHLDRLPTRPMPGQLRDFFEPRFGRSFDDVDLSTGPQAESLAARLGARAFAVGDTIGFARGAFEPNTFAGRWLLAHELTHVSQNEEPQTTIVRRSPPIEDPSLASQISRELLLADSQSAIASLIRNIGDIILLQKTRDDVLANFQFFGVGQAQVESILAALDARAFELIELEKRGEDQALEIFVEKVTTIMKATKSSKLEPLDVDYLNQLLNAMSPRTLKHLERRLALWPKSGVAHKMKKVLELVTARTRQSDAVESQRGRFDEGVGEGLHETLDTQARADYDEGNQCLKFLDEVGVGLLFSEQSDRVAAADDEYRNLSNYNKKDQLHGEATLSRLASELRIQDLVGPINVLLWSKTAEAYNPSPHEVIDNLSSAGDGWYFFLCSVGSFHTLMVVVHNTGGRRKYFELSNHGSVERKDHEDLDAKTFNKYEPWPSRIWQVYVKPAT